ncbi:uncharacterized protein LOC141811056 [Halichoeres trimaculatus]|uniref:uncharacterized protein LOC141811056 n=1 Tax=Halichoeres trimaculatus TaxID=147232 RepID=UPI003D9EC203
MERYESLGLVGEGSYGTVLKCRHRESGRLVAIKKFQDSDDDKTVKKIAQREIKLLRQLRHENLVNLLEVWKRRRRWYLVFEFVERTLLDDLEQNQSGLDLNTSRQFLFQILRAVAFCHQQNIIHRDIKPENILISQGGVVKLCDFGFARTMTAPSDGAVYTDYVATRWYRAPELLVGDTKYGKPVDVWAVGCLLLEMLTGQPLFPGDSDLDQIYHIVRCFGNLTAHHQELFYRNPVFSGVRLPQCSGKVQLEQRFPSIPANALDIAQNCLQLDPENRAQCSELLEHTMFTHDSFDVRFLDELNVKIQKEHRENSTLPKIARAQRREKDDGDAKTGRGKDKKQHEEKSSKEKEKVDKEDKLPKTKGKQPSKPKNIRNTSEPTMSTKQSKTTTAKIIDSPAKPSKNNHEKSMRCKAAKTTGAEVRKDPENPKPQSSDPSEASSMTTGNLVDVTPKKTQEKTINLPNKHVSSEAERSVMEKQKSPKFEASRDCGESRNTSNPKILSDIDTVNTLSPSLKAFTDQTETESAQETSQMSRPEYPKATELSNRDLTVQAAEVAGTSVSPCKMTTSSKHYKRLNVDTKQRLTSECPKVLPSTTNPSKTTSKSGPKITKGSTSLSSGPFKSLTSDLSAQSSQVFVGESLGNVSTTATKGTLRTRSSLDTKPLDNTTFIPVEPLTDFQTDKDFDEALSRNTLKENVKENHGLLTRNLKKDSQYFETSCVSSNIHQQSTTTSKITTEPRAKSISMPPDEIPKTRTPLGIRKALKVSDKDNREDVSSSSFPVESSLDHTSEVEKKEPSLKSLKSLHSMMGDPKTALESFGNHTTSPTTMTSESLKTTFPTEMRKKRDNSDRNDSTDVSTNSDSTPVANPDHGSPIGILHNLYTVDRDVLSSSPPPPPPPPSSTPLQLLRPSSTHLVPSISAVSTSSPSSSDHFYSGAGFHPGLHDLRASDKPRNQGGIYGRPTQQSLPGHLTGSLSYQVPEKSHIREHSFQSDLCHFSSTSSIMGTKRKSDIHLPDLKSSTRPELKGKEGMNSKHAQKP